MKVINYKYCSLNYTHSQVLNESLNLGYLLYIQEINKFIFKWTKNLNRIKNLYTDFPEKTIRENIKSIENNVDKLNKNFNLFILEETNDFQELVNNYLLQKDGSSLQFSNFKKSELYNLDFNSIEDYFDKTYLIEYIKPSRAYSGEPDLIKKFLNRFKDINKQLIDKKLISNYIIKNNSGIDIKFDFAWQNGSFNLVKAVSLDLKEEKNIIEKAYKNIGQLIDAEKTLANKDIRLDLLVGKPHEKKLFKSYDYAIDLMNNMNKINIIEEENITTYADNTIHYLIKGT